MATVYDLFVFLACYLDFASVSDDNVVTTVNSWIIDRFMLSHQDKSNALSEFPENTLVGVDVVPYSCICECGVSNRLRHTVYALGVNVASLKRLEVR